MSPEQEPLTPFERNARTVLEESVQRVDARTRSRLNQARQAALAAAAAGPAWWRSFTLMPAAGAVAAALLVAVTLWHREPASELPVLDAQRSAVEDMDPDAFDDCVRINLGSMFRCTRLAVPMLRELPGSIVFQYLARDRRIGARAIADGAGAPVRGRAP